jgi:phytanoyl-CoA hydroxylase
MNSRNILKKYEKNGFIVLNKIFSQDDIKKIYLDLLKIKKILPKIKNKKFFHQTSDGKINTIHNIHEFYKNNKIKNIVNKKKLTSVLNTILGKNSEIRNIEFFLKPKKTGLPSPYHQDNFYWNIIDSKAVNVWIACSDSSKSNGGICYLKGSNKLGTIKHELSMMKGSSQKIPKSVLNKLKFQKIFPSIKTGDCIIHHPEVIHGSLKNISNKDRIGLAVSFISKNAKTDKRKLSNYKKNIKKNLKKIYN